MTITNTDIMSIQSKIHGWIGHSPWNVSLGIGSYVTMDFGKELSVQATSTQTYVRGQWRLWIRYCCWRIEVRDRVLAGSDDPQEKLEKALKYFSQTRLTAVHLSPPAPDVALYFEPDIVLRLFPFNFTGDHIDWYLFTPEREVLVFGGGKSWECVPEN